MFAADVTDDDIFVSETSGIANTPNVNVTTTDKSMKRTTDGSPSRSRSRSVSRSRSHVRSRVSTKQKSPEKQRERERKQKSRSRSPQRHNPHFNKHKQYDRRDVRDIRHHKSENKRKDNQRGPWPTDVKPSRVIGIFGLDFNTTVDEIRRECKRHGVVETLHKVPHKNYAFVYYKSLEDATRARRMMNGMKFGTRFIRVDYSTTDKSTETLKVRKHE